MLPLHPTDAYVLDRAPRFDQINGDHRNTQFISRNVALDSLPYDHIEPVTMSQQVTSPDIAIPSVEFGSGTVKSNDLNQNVANI